MIYVNTYTGISTYVYRYCSKKKLAHPVCIYIHEMYWIIISPSLLRSYRAYFENISVP